MPPAAPAAFPTRATRPACCHDASDPQLPALAWRVRTARRQSSLIAMLLEFSLELRLLLFSFCGLLTHYLNEFSYSLQDLVIRENNDTVQTVTEVFESRALSPGIKLC